MTDTPISADKESAAGANNDRPLSAMRVADLQTIAQGLGIKGGARMRKSALIEAIEAARGSKAEGSPAAANDTSKATPDAATKQADERPAAQEPEGEVRSAEQSTDQATADAQPVDEGRPQPAKQRRATSSKSNRAEQVAAETESQDAADGSDDDSRGKAAHQQQDGQQQNRQQQSQQKADSQRGEQGNRQKQSDRGGQRGQRDDSANKQDNAGDTPRTLDEIVLPPAREEQDDTDSAHDNKQQDQQSSGRKRNRNRNRGKSQQSDDNQSSDQSGTKQGGDNGKQDDSQRPQNQKATGRQRDRKRNQRDDADPEIAPDDVLLPIAGILDVLDNYAFVRTSGYLAGVNDVYVSLGQVKKYGLRKGDAIVGAIRQPREGEYQGGRQKYNALVRIDTINGDAPDTNRQRAEFDDLTPLYPEERLTLETSNGHAAQRMIDLFAPIGKGTRGLIIAPPKSGKSIILERIANAIAQNSPDTHLMLVLVDERPEEVTRLQRTIHGEVVASTFDMPAENHTTVAELAIERAKRLVELGLDVVVLLDSITQLCRAYNLTAPASGRIIAGGVDASALYPPKRFFGAARKVENGGSLTILATAMVETGSRTDEVILEEFAGTGNMELRLSREIADKRIFPALDIQQSSTLHEEQLLNSAELEATWAIRRALHGDAQASLEAVLERISSTSSNRDFMESVRANPISTAGDK